MSSAGAARTRSRRSSTCTTASTTTLSLVLGVTRRGRARHGVTRARDLRPQGHLLPRGHTETFQPSVHNCSRHDLSQPSQRLSFAVAPPRRDFARFHDRISVPVRLWQQSSQEAQRGLGPIISRLEAGRARVSRLPGQPYKSGDEGIQSGKTR